MATDPFDDRERVFGLVSQQFGTELAGVPTDLVDEGEAYVVRADLPGYRPDDVDVSLRDARTLRITASRREDQPDGRYVRHERRQHRRPDGLAPRTRRGRGGDRRVRRWRADRPAREARHRQRRRRYRHPCELIGGEQAGYVPHTHGAGRDSAGGGRPQAEAGGIFLFDGQLE